MLIYKPIYKIYNNKYDKLRTRILLHRLPHVVLPDCDHPVDQQRSAR